LTEVGRSAGQGGSPVALGEPAAGPAGWRRTHRQARAAFGVVLLGAFPFARYADVALPAAVLRDEDLTALLGEKFTLALKERSGSDRGLAITLRAYLDTGCNLSATAVALGLARRTVAGRLATIEEAIGRPVHTCLAELDLALRLQAFGLQDFTCER
jgi:DNA-binding PucR family transcriptional regulator